MLVKKKRVAQKDGFTRVSETDMYPCIKLVLTLKSLSLKGSSFSPLNLDSVQLHIIFDENMMKKAIFILGNLRCRFQKQK